jgi:hypothetical protein
MAEELKERYMNVTFKEEEIELQGICNGEDLIQLTATLLTHIYNESPSAVLAVLYEFSKTVKLRTPDNPESVIN